MESAFDQQTFQELIDGTIQQWGLENVQNVAFADAGLKSIKGLEKLMFLGEIDLSKNVITDLSPLRNLTKLHVLNLSENNISDIGPLTGLSQVHKLILNGNLIPSIEALEPIKSLSNLEELIIHGNPLCTDERYPKDVFALQKNLLKVDGYFRQDFEENDDTLHGGDRDTHYMNYDETMAMDRVRSLETQLDAMKSAFQVLERETAENGLEAAQHIASTAIDTADGTVESTEIAQIEGLVHDYPYYRVLQSWREKAVDCMISKEIAERQVQQQISAFKTERSEHKTRLDRLEARYIAEKQQRKGLEAEVDRLQRIEQALSNQVIKTCASKQDLTKELAQCKHDLRVMKHVFEQLGDKVSRFCFESDLQLKNKLDRMAGQEAKVKDAVERVKFANKALELERIRLRNDAAMLEQEKVLFKEETRREIDRKARENATKKKDTSGVHVKPNSGLFGDSGDKKHSNERKSGVSGSVMSADARASTTGGGSHANGDDDDDSHSHQSLKSKLLRHMNDEEGENIYLNLDDPEGRVNEGHVIRSRHTKGTAESLQTLAHAQAQATEDEAEPDLSQLTKFMAYSDPSVEAEGILMDLFRALSITGSTVKTTDLLCNIFKNYELSSEMYTFDMLHVYLLDILCESDLVTLLQSGDFFCPLGVEIFQLLGDTQFVRLLLNLLCIPVESACSDGNLIDDAIQGKDVITRGGELTWGELLLQLFPSLMPGTRGYAAQVRYIQNQILPHVTTVDGRPATNTLEVARRYLLSGDSRSTLTEQDRINLKNAGLLGDGKFCPVPLSIPSSCLVETYESRSSGSGTGAGTGATAGAFVGGGGARGGGGPSGEYKRDDGRRGEVKSLSTTAYNTIIPPPTFSELQSDNIRLETEKRYLLNTVQEMTRSLNKRAEGIRHYFATDIQRSAVRIEKLNVELKHLTRELDSVTARLRNAEQTHRARFEDLSERNKTLLQKNHDLSEELTKRTTDILREKNDQIAILESRLAVVEDREKSLVREAKTANHQLTGARRQEVTLEKSVRELNTKVTALQKQIEALKREKEAETTHLRECEATWAKEKSELLERLNMSQTEISELKLAAVAVGTAAEKAATATSNTESRQEGEGNDEDATVATHTKPSSTLASQRASPQQQQQQQPPHMQSQVQTPSLQQPGYPGVATGATGGGIHSKGQQRAPQHAPSPAQHPQHPQQYQFHGVASVEGGGRGPHVNLIHGQVQQHQQQQQQLSYHYGASPLQQQQHFPQHQYHAQQQSPYGTMPSFQLPPQAQAQAAAAATTVNGAAGDLESEVQGELREAAFILRSGTAASNPLLQEKHSRLARLREKLLYSDF